MTLTSARLLVQTTAIAVRASPAAVHRAPSQGTRTVAPAALWLCDLGAPHPAVVLLHVRFPLRAGAGEGVAAGRVRAVAAVRVSAATAVTETARGLSMVVVAVLIGETLVGKTLRVKGVPSLRWEIEEGAHCARRRESRARTRVAHRKGSWTRKHESELRQRLSSSPVFPRYDAGLFDRSLWT